MFEMPHTQEVPSKRESFQQRLDHLQKLKQACGHFDDLQDTEFLFTPRCVRNQISIIPEGTPERIALIPTGAGAITEKGQDIATDHIFGCAGLLILGPTKNGFVHLTPSGDIPYRDVDFPGNENLFRRGSAQKILEALENGNQSLEQTQMIILVNAGDMSRNSKFYYQDTERAVDDLRRIFLEAGISSVNIVELPLDNTLLYYSDDQPTTIETFGNPISYGPTNELLIDKTTTEHFSIPIDPQLPLPFHINRPSPESILLEQEKTINQEDSPKNSPRNRYIDLLD